MALVSNVLRPFWLTGLNDISGEVTTPFKGWLTGGAYVLSSVGAKGEVTFFTAVFEEVVRSFACDVNRAAIAAFESIYGLPSPLELHRSTAWTLIRCYYSAYYSAHALCRILSKGVTQLDQEQLNEVNKAITLSGSSARLQPGMYRIELDPSANLFTLVPLKKRSHEETWAETGVLAEEVAEKLLSQAWSHATDEDIQTIATVLLKIVDVMKTAPCYRGYNWLSYMRNEINYRYQHGAWYPHVRASKFREKVLDYVVAWRKDPTEIYQNENEVLVKFSQTCVLYVSILRDIVLDMMSRNSNDDSFLKYGVMRVLK